MKRLFIFSLVFVSLVLLGTSRLGVTKAYATTYTAAQLLSGTHTVQMTSKQFQGTCIDDYAGSTANQNPIQMYDCLRHPNQYFTIVPINSTQVSIQFQGKCVDIMWGGTANGTKVWLWDCTYGAAQIWTMTDNDTFRNPASGRCLDGESATNYTQLKIWDCNGLNYQNWTIEDPNSMPPVMNAEFRSKAYPGKCLDTQFGRITNETPIQSYDCFSNGPQRFYYIVPITPSLVKIQFTDKCLDIRANGTANGSLIQVWDCTGTANQIWLRTASGAFKNPQSNRCLDIGYNGVNGTWLWIWDCSGLDNQNFYTVTPSDLLYGSSNIELSSQQYTGKCIESRNGSTTPGTAVQINDCATNANQLLDAVGLNYYSVYLKYKGMCFENSGAGTANGTPVILNTCRSASDPLFDTQQWVVYSDNIFKNWRSQKCLHAPSGTNGTQLQIFDCNGAGGQSWSYRKIFNSATGGNLSNLNFGISNYFPWMQSVCGDMRIDNGFNNSMPAGKTAIITNASCATPGLVFTGDSSANFGQGQVSSTNQLVGGTNYSEVYSSSGLNGLFTSYASLSQKAQTGGVTSIDLATICTLSNCTLPANLTHGVYKANGDVAMNAYTFPANQAYVFLINGNLTIKGNIITPPNVNTSVFFSTTGNMTVLPTVGVAPPATTANVSGIFSSDKSFIVQSNNNCTDLKFNFEGTLIVNAARGGGSLQNFRNLCDNNATSPNISFTQRLDMLFSLPAFLKTQRTISKEAAP